MKRFTFYIVFICLCGLVWPQCPRIAVRKEIRDLTQNELGRFHNACLALNRRSSPSEITIWDRFARLHLSFVSVAHGYMHSLSYENFLL